VHAASPRQAARALRALSNAALQPMSQALLPSRGPSKYTAAALTVEVCVVVVSVVENRFLWIRVQASVPSPAASIAARLPVQKRHAQSLHPNECNAVQAGSAVQLASASSRVPKSLLQNASNASLSARGPSTYSWVTVNELVLGMLVVVEVNVLVTVVTYFSFVHAAEPAPVLDRSPTEPAQVRQSQGWQSKEWMDLQVMSPLHFAIASSRLLRLESQCPTQASLPTRGPSMYWTAPAMDVVVEAATLVHAKVSEPEVTMSSKVPQHGRQNRSSQS